MAELAYTERGKGPSVLFIHGFCEDKSIWKSFDEKLSEYFNVICLDLPGFGESQLIKPAPTIEWFAEQIINLLQFLNISKVTVIGHSLGGYVALALAEKHPEYIKGLGLFHSTSFADSKEKKEIRNKALSFVEKNGSEKFISSMFPNLFSKNNLEIFKKEVDCLIKAALKTPQKSVLATTKAMRDRLDRSQVLENLNAPVLFIIGNQDQAVPIDHSLKQITLPKDSHIYINDEIGHMGMIEANAKTQFAVFNFVNYCNNVKL